MNKLLLEVVNFYRIPPKTRRGLGDAPIPHSNILHSDGKGHAVTHHIKYVSDDGETIITHEVTQHFRDDKKPHILPNVIRTSFDHHGSTSKIIHPEPKTEEEKEKLKKIRKGDVRTALGIKKHIRETIPKLSNEYGAKEWRISAADDNPDIRARKASIYKKLMIDVAEKHGARRRFLGIPLPWLQKPKEVTSTAFSLKLNEQKNIPYSVIKHIRGRMQ